MTQSFSHYATCALTTGLQKELDYGVDESLLEQVQIGSLVQVPLRGRLVSAVVLAMKAQSKVPRIKPIHKILHPLPLMTPKLFELAKWMSEYYVTDLPRVLKLFFPKEVREELGHKQQFIVKKKKTFSEIQAYCLENRSKKPKQVVLLDELLKVEGGILLTELLERAKATRASLQSLEKSGLVECLKTYIDRCPLEKAEFFSVKPKKLNEAQEQVLKILERDLYEETFKVSLIHGVTGSGKTEVYLKMIEACLKKGKSALLLVPEIALTTQTIEKFKGRFQGKIALLHHRLSQGERYDAWHRIRKKEVSLVIGARSAIFAPLVDLGLIIIDEEHESSYKQTEEMPTYHARDLAVMRGKIESCLVVLGSATPSFESYHNALKGKYQLLEINHRFSGSSLPQVRLIDMKREIERSEGFTLFSEELIKEIKKRYEKGEQVLLFLNRKGYHTTLICKGCGEIVRCPDCDLALTFHLKGAELACHLCDYRTPAPKWCKKCGEPTLQYKGVGTEKVHEQLKKILPNLRILRMDGETTKHKGSYQELYYGFRNQKADVLIGTQMVAKGLDFPNVTLVGILNGDSQLSIPDFKGAESTFQLMTQVAGRAGRGLTEGEVLLQTFRPENKVLQLALKQDFPSFYAMEIDSRSLFSFPPFMQLIKVVFKSKKEEQALHEAQVCHQFLKKKSTSKVFIVEPLPCGYPKIKAYFRYQVLIKAEVLKQTLGVLREYLSFAQKNKGVKVLIDVNPASTFF